MPNYAEVVQVEARKLSLLTPDGELTTLDSLSIVDLLDALELATGLSVPLEEITTAAFANTQSVAELLSRVAQRAQS